MLPLKPGAELVAVDMVLRSAPAGSVSGKVASIPGEWRSRRAAVALIPRGGVRIPVATAYTGEDGRFAFAQIPVGEYFLISWGEAADLDDSRPPSEAQARYATATISVRADEEARVDLELAAGVRLELNNSAGWPDECIGFSSLRITAEGPWPETWHFNPQRTTARTVWEGLPRGTYRIDMPDLEPSCAFLGVRDVADGEPRTSLALNSPARMAVVGTSFRGEVSGTVYASKRPAKRVLVILRSDDTGTARGTETDDAGAFRFLGLPPGKYRMFPLHASNARQHPAGAVPALKTFSLNEADNLQFDLNLEEESH